MQERSEVTFSAQGVGPEWFVWFRANKQDAFEKALVRALERVEDSGINLGEVFSAQNYTISEPYSYFEGMGKPITEEQLEQGRIAAEKALQLIYPSH